MTAVSVWLGHGGGSRRAATVGVVIAAFAKVLVIGESFMELHLAPPWLRWGFATWAAGMATALVLLYLS
jgi:hypothetical protein